MNKLRSKSVRYILFLIYGILLIVNLCTGVLLFVQSMTAQKEEIDVSRMNNMKMLKKDAEDIFYENYDFVNFIQYSYPADELITADYSSNRPLIIYTLMQLQKDIKDFSAKLDNGASRYVYFPGIEMVVSEQFITEAEKFHSIICDENSVSYDEWKKLILSTNNVPVSIVGADEGKSMLVSVSCLTDDTGDVECSVIFIMDEASLMNALGEYSVGLDGEIRFLNADGKTIFSMGEKVGYNPEISAFSENNGVFHAKGKGISFMWNRSDIKGMTFANIMPTSRYYIRLSKQRLTMILSIAVMFIAGLMLYGICFKYQMKNIDMIMSELNINGSNDNEFERIRNAVRNMSDNQKKFQEYLDLTGTITRDTIFYKMADGSLNLKNFSRKQLDIFGIELEEPFFAVVGAKVYDKLKAGNPIDGKKFEECLFEFKEQLPKMLEACYSGMYDYEYNGYLYMVFNLSYEESLDFTEICSDELRYLTGQIEKESGALIIAAVSDVYSSDTALKECSEDVSEILEYNCISFDSVVYSKKQLEEVLGGLSGYGYSEQDEKKIITAVMSGDEKYAKSVFEAVFDKCAAKTAQSYLILRCITFDFSETMIKIWNDIGENSDVPYKEKLIDRTMGAASFRAIKQIFVEEVESLCSMVKSISEKKDFITQIDKYISDNYADCDLSLKTIADFFNINPVYLSNTYKKRKGEGILKMITHIRMEKAGELLKEGLSVSEVSVKVGYIYPNTFSRAFKKYFGVSPTEYK